MIISVQFHDEGCAWSLGLQANILTCMVVHAWLERLANYQLLPLVQVNDEGCVLSLGLQVNILMCILVHAWHNAGPVIVLTTSCGPRSSQADT